MIRPRRLGAVLALALLGLSSPFAGDASGCVLEDAPAALDSTADAWVASAPVALRRLLDEDGVAFPTQTLPKRAIAALCPAVTPAVVRFDLPPSAVFDLLIQTDRHGEFMDSLGGMSPVSRAPSDHVDRHEVKILFTSLVYHVRHHWDEERLRIWWDLSPAHENDLRGITGYWELYPLEDGGALGFYGTSVDVGPIIPKRMQAGLTARNLRSAVGRIRAWVIANGERTR